MTAPDRPCDSCASTVTPSPVPLVLIALPSFGLIYGMDDAPDPAVTVEAVGHQWYWCYEYVDYDNEGLFVDTYIIPEEKYE